MSSLEADKILLIFLSVRELTAFCGQTLSSADFPAKPETGYPTVLGYL
jgi:hypothetical protein